MESQNISNNENLKTIESKTALHKLKRKMPYGWDLNIYRGCQHRCAYCYALYSHDYLNDSDYFGSVYVKSNISEVLERELKSKNWKREVVNIGGVTDSYQPCEAEYQIMPEILKLLIKYKTPAIISTKSDLILRDHELIGKLSRITYINVAATIITADEKIRASLEPGSCGSLKRFAMLKAFRKTNASVGLHVMPIIPFLTDDYENFNLICTLAKQAGVHYMLPGVLYLRGKTRQFFLDYIKSNHPHIYDDFRLLYQKGGADKAYKDQLYSMVNQLRDQYQISRSYIKPMREKMNQSQIELF